MTKYLTTMMAGLILVLGWMELSAAPTRQVKKGEYEIYPKPQKIVYNSQNFAISKAVNLVFDKGIDVYTKNRLKRILKRKGLKFKTSRKSVVGKTNVLVGLNKSGDFVDRYFDSRISHKESFFDKIDSHIVSVKSNTIAVLGADADSAFYGVTTLKHVFNQLDKNKIKGFRIDDYSNVKHRGFIEGYYGNPWSNEDRAELMKFGGDYKLNTYFFAPKDDAYHNSKWRELYPEKELAEIKKLAKVGNETKNKYVYALHTFMHRAIRFDTESNYQHDLKIVKAKFTQLLENDVRAFSILADDAGVPPQGPSTYVKLLNDLTKWLIKQKKKYPDLVTDIPFCPNDYGGNGSSTQLRETNKAPDSVSIIMTGGRVWGEVSEGFTSNFIKNIASPGHKGRASYLWINWPCSDNSKQHLIMGGNDTFLHPGVTPSNIQGIILNPMQQAEANKSALFAIADYGWNVWDSKAEADQNWYDSFKYMNHGTAEEKKSSSALRTIAKHMINQNMDGRVRSLEESLELSPKLKSFQEDLKTGNVKKDDIAELIKEFKTLQNAAAYYQKNAGNKRTKAQVIHWLKCWKDTATASISYLKCIEAVQANKKSDIWTHYSTAQTAFEKSKTYKFKYVNHYENAEVGVQYIVPFIKTMGEHLNGIVSEIVSVDSIDRASQKAAVFTNTRYNLRANGNLEQATLKSSKKISLSPKQYIGLKLERIKDLKSINKSLTSNKLTVQVSKNAVEWESVQGSHIPAARYVRLINKTKNRIKFSLDKFEVKSNEIQPIREVKAYAPLYKESKIESAFDGDFNTSTFYTKGFTTGDSIVYDFGQTLDIDNLRYVVLDSERDHIRDARFQLSLDGKTWNDAFKTKRLTGDGNAKPQDNGYTHGSLSKGVIPISHAYLEGKNLNTKARFMRILATGNYGGRWVKISEILINNGKYIKTTNNPTFASKVIELKNHSPEKMTDGDLTSSYRPDTNKGKIKKGSITYKLSETTKVKKINIIQNGNAISNATVLARVGKSKWVKIGALRKSLNEISNTKYKHIFEIKILWKGVAPTIYEIVTVPSKA